MQPLTFNLAPTANTKPVQEANAGHASQAHLAGETIGPDLQKTHARQKAFASLLSHQLTQQRQMQHASVTEQAVDSKRSNPAWPDATLGLTDIAQGALALLEDTMPLTLVQESPAHAPMQDMLLMQMQTPMAVNAVISPVNPSVEGMPRLEGDDLAFATPPQAPAAPILNGETTPKNSLADTGRVQPDGAVDKRVPLPDSTDRLAPIVNQQADSANKTVEPSFKEAMNTATTSVVNQPLQALSKLETSPATQVAVASTAISPAFGKADWNQAIQQRVVWMVGSGEQSATLTLNPPDLGPLKVVVQVDNQHVNTTFTSDNAEVRQALEDGMQMLREKMQESGIQLGNAHVNAGSHSDRDAQQASQDTARQRALASDEGLSAEEPAPVTQRRVSQGLVDTFA